MENTSKKRETFKDIRKRFLANASFHKIRWDIEHTRIFDFYRFFKEFGVVEHSVVDIDKDWGCFFKEAIINYKGSKAFFLYDEMEVKGKFIVFDKKESNIKELNKELDEWINKNNTFRGQTFTYPSLKRPKMSSRHFINNDIKEMLQENVISFFEKLEDVKELGLKTKKGILLHGEPGNGKTSICRWLSEYLPEVTRIWVGNWRMHPHEISEVFRIARELSPSIIFLEDIDTIGVDRDLSIGVTEPLLGILLNEMDGIEENEGVVVVATTNSFYSIDRALLNRPGRFDIKICVKNPSPSTIKEITGHEDDITLAEAFHRKESIIYHEKILGKKWNIPAKRQKIHYIG